MSERPKFTPEPERAREEVCFPDQESAADYPVDEAVVCFVLVDTRSKQLRAGRVASTTDRQATVEFEEPLPGAIGYERSTGSPQSRTTRKFTFGEGVMMRRTDFIRLRLNPDLIEEWLSRSSFFDPKDEKYMGIKLRNNGIEKKKAPGTLNRSNTFGSRGTTSGTRPQR